MSDTERLEFVMQFFRVEDVGDADVCPGMVVDIDDVSAAFDCGPLADETVTICGGWQNPDMRRAIDKAMAYAAKSALSVNDDVDGWYCPRCVAIVSGEHVTFHETHDPRCGGCGDQVYAAKERMNTTGGCVWSEDRFACFHPACTDDETWEKHQGGPKANAFKYCPFCGKTVVEMPYKEVEG